MRAVLPVLAAALLLAGPAEAGPWVSEAGHGYAKVSLRWLPAFLWTPGPERADATTPAQRVLYGPYNELGLGLYGEHALGARVAVWAHWDLARVFVLTDPRDDGTEVFASLGEPTLGLRAQLVQAGGFALGVEGAVTLPVQDNAPVADVYSAAEGHPRIAELRIATGVWDLQAALSAGVGWSRTYLSGSVGLKGRGGGWDSVLLWSAEVGRTLGAAERVRGRVRFAGHHPLGDGDAPYHDSVSGLGNGTNYVGFTIELDLLVRGPWWLGVSLAGGLGLVQRQTGGPVIGLSIAADY